MKKIFYLSVCLLTLLSLAGCGGMDEVSREFLEDGPVVYIAKATNVKVASGEYKVKISWNKLSDPRITGADILWNSGKSSISVDWDPSSDFETIIPDLPEGSMVFEIFTHDRHGNRSVPVSVSGTVYGSKFESTLDPSVVTSAILDEGTVAVGIAHSTVLYYMNMVINYTNSGGEQRSVEVTSSQKNIILEDFGGETFTYKSIFVPEEGSLDTFYSEEAVCTPVEVVPELNVGKEEVVLASLAGSSTKVEVSTNRPPFSVSVPEEDASWLSAEIVGDKVVISAKSTNEDPGNRSGKVQVQVKKVVKEITVTQTLNRIGTAYKDEGVIFYQNPDNPVEYTIVSKNSVKMTWSKTANPTGATGTNGKTMVGGVEKDNNELVMAMSDYETGGYAVKWCKDYGEGWYMPSLDELHALFAAYNGVSSFEKTTSAKPNALPAAEANARVAFDKLLTDMGGTKINTAADTAAGDTIYACCEDAGGTKAYVIRVGQKLSADTAYAKSSTERFVRAVKKVIIE